MHGLPDQTGLGYQTHKDIPSEWCGSMKDIDAEALLTNWLALQKKHTAVALNILQTFPQKEEHGVIIAWQNLMHPAPTVLPLQEQWNDQR